MRSFCGWVFQRAQHQEAQAKALLAEHEARRVAQSELAKETARVEALTDVLALAISYPETSDAIHELMRHWHEIGLRSLTATCDARMLGDLDMGMVTISVGLDLHDMRDHLYLAQRMDREKWEHFQRQKGERRHSSDRWKV